MTPRSTNNLQKVILITGASSGIGAALARRLAKPGIGLVLHARKSVDALDSVAKGARASGAEVETVLGDITDAGVPEAIVQSAKTRFQRLDALVANAGFPILKALDESTMSDLEYAFRGNAISFFSLARSAHPLLSKSNCARIVAVGSFTAHLFRTDMRQFPVSAASKGALVTAVHSLALAYAVDGITVNCVVPGFIAKDQGTPDALSDAEYVEIRKRVPLARIGQPNDVAAMLDFLTTEDASYITGQTIHISGGLV